MVCLVSEEQFVFACLFQWFLIVLWTSDYLLTFLFCGFACALDWIIFEVSSERCGFWTLVFVFLILCVLHFSCFVLFAIKNLPMDPNLMSELPSLQNASPTLDLAGLYDVGHLDYAKGFCNVLLFLVAFLRPFPQTLQRLLLSCSCLLVRCYCCLGSSGH